MSEFVKFVLSLFGRLTLSEATFLSATFCARMCGIKDTGDVLRVRIARFGNYFFEFSLFRALH